MELSEQEIELVRDYLVGLDCPIEESVSNAICDAAIEQERK